MKGVIDRFEGDFAVISTDGGRGLVSKSLLEGAEENDIIELNFDKSESSDRKGRISSLRRKLEKNRE